MVSKDVIFDEKTFYYISDKKTTLRDLPYLQLLDTSISSSRNPTNSSNSTKDSTLHEVCQSHLPEFSVNDDNFPSSDEYPASAQMDSTATEHQESTPLESVAVEVIPTKQDSVVDAHESTYPKFYERRQKSSSTRDQPDSHELQSQGGGELLPEGGVPEEELDLG